MPSSNTLDKVKPMNALRQCKHCATEIAAPASDVDTHQPITCPVCNAVFYATDDEKALVPFTPSTRSLPAKMTIRAVDDELLITRHRRGVLFIGLLAITSFLLLFGLFGSEMHTLEFLMNPLAWIIASFFYYSLKNTVNTTHIRISPTALQINEGPLLPRWHTSVTASNITQLYVKKIVRRGNKSTTTTYDLNFVQKIGSDRTIVTGLERAEQALFLEQEIERFLGFEDRSIKGAHEANPFADFTGWRTFADTNHLTYTYGKLLAGHRVHGYHEDHWVELLIMQPRLALSPQTRLTITAVDRPKKFPLTPDSLTLAAATNLLAAPIQSPVDLRGKFEIMEEGKILFYEEAEVQTEALYLQIVFDWLVRFRPAYPHIIALEGAMMPRLQPIALDNNHPAQPLARHLIKTIAAATRHLAHADATLLLCPDCLTRTTVHQIDLGWAALITYYGCRQCHQSRNFLNAKQVVAVLDHKAGSKKLKQKGQTLRVNGLARSALFDFNALAIVAATDEEVERWAIQVGNDTDPVRQGRYKQLTCTIAPDCALSENTLRILRRTFGPVQIEPAGE
ncbi:MAG: hypothetical protein KDJ52_02565 [Anaerolineae bacterium]|nr:hypothetical protein [Anaerolineae bacterium]